MRKGLSHNRRTRGVNNGVASLIGVIVSHMIVLFDFIEEMHEKGEPLERALPDAGIERIRPVIITVGAMILALFPLDELDSACSSYAGTSNISSLTNRAPLAHSRLRLVCLTKYRIIVLPHSSKSWSPQSLGNDRQPSLPRNQLPQD